MTRSTVWSAAGDDNLDYTTTFSFDLASNRIESSKDEGSDGSADEIITYIYDANDRLLIEQLDSDGDTVIDETTTYAFGPNADFSDAQNPYGGDHTTQTQKTVRSGDTTTGSYNSRTQYSYDVMGRKSQVQVDSDGDGTFDTTTTYEYDHRGLRISETTGSGTKEYLFDTRNPTGHAQVLEEYVNDVLSKTFVHGHDVIAQHDSTSGGDTLTLLYDGHGSTRALVDTAAAIAQAFAYDAYGNHLTNANLTAADAALTNLLYSGEWTGQHGAQYLRARWYDPDTGRFNRLDPWSGNARDPQSLHKYLYTHANPVMGVDPSGRSWSSIGQLAVSGIRATLRRLKSVPTLYQRYRAARLTGALLVGANAFATAINMQGDGPLWGGEPDALIFSFSLSLGLGATGGGGTDFLIFLDNPKVVYVYGIVSGAFAGIGSGLTLSGNLSGGAVWGLSSPEDYAGRGATLSYASSAPPVNLLPFPPSSGLSLPSNTYTFNTFTDFPSLGMVGFTIGRGFSDPVGSGDFSVGYATAFDVGSFKLPSMPWVSSLPQTGDPNALFDFLARYESSIQSTLESLV